MDQRQYKANGTHYSKFQTYLTASEYFLQQRNLEDCRNYALKAIEIDPNQTSPSQILAIANVLLLSTTINEDPNYYSILNLPLYTQNQQLIKTHFTNVTNLLNPNKNRYPFASEAFGVVLRAWSVLSNPTQKTLFDNGLKNKEKGRNTFWTVCPYCYYVYEFLKDYEDCCLRCQNEKCRRVFHGVSIVGPPPPPEVAEKGEYHCFGFSVLGEYLWSPFVATKTNENNVESEIVREKTNEKKAVDEFIEISDDDEEKDENGGKEKSLGVEEIIVETNGGEVDKGCTSIGGNLKKKRIKVVAKSSNKVLGKGDKVNMNEIVYNVEGNDDFEFGNVGEKTNENTVEFGNVREKTNENTIEFGNVEEKTNENIDEFGNVEEKTNENTVEFRNMEKKTDENTVEFGNPGEKTNENNVEFGIVGDNNVDFFMGEDDIYVRMQEGFDIGTLFF
ncbi:uncharacterized protein LOC129885098 [Solanum dulcamara]|uniref:uncharacterized protein LOC129885098 n=1 Tax=Solanum dulcamara TaxID=45834 RepID=UPI002486C977|nr:uncharacterized protein LOC129885098 [Solanum dulcamara]